MTWTPTAKRRAYLALAALGAIAAMALRRPELAILAVPFGALAAAAPVARPELDVGEAAVAPRRTVEGGEVTVRLELSVAGPIAAVEVRPAVGAAFAFAGVRRVTAGGVAPPRGTAAVAVRAGESFALEVGLRARHWGAHAVGAVVLRAHDGAGMAIADRRVDLPDVVQVLPSDEALREPIAPSGTQPAPGDWPSRRRGGGTELAEIRPFRPGDPLRAINWRATARRDQPYVTERRAERTAEVVLFLDSFADVGGTIERAVRAALAIAREHLDRRDRVGLVSFGGAVSWLAPGIGRGQVARMVEALLRSHVVANVAWHDVRHVPRRALPPQATVIALTPLFDERALAALADLARRRFDVAILEVEPEPAPGATAADAVADRLWALQREDLRARFARIGAHCVRWPPGQPLQAAVTELDARRRRPLHA